MRNLILIIIIFTFRKFLNNCTFPILRAPSTNAADFPMDNSFHLSKSLYIFLLNIIYFILYRKYKTNFKNVQRIYLTNFINVVSRYFTKIKNVYLYILAKMRIVNKKQQFFPLKVHYFTLFFLCPLYQNQESSPK